jgi:hypothetical protein
LVGGIVAAVKDERVRGWGQQQDEAEQGVGEKLTGARHTTKAI